MFWRGSRLFFFAACPARGPEASGGPGCGGRRCCRRVGRERYCSPPASALPLAAGCRGGKGEGQERAASGPVSVIEGRGEGDSAVHRDAVTEKNGSDPAEADDKALPLQRQGSRPGSGSQCGQQDSDNISIPVSHVGDVLGMVDVLIEGSDGLDEEIGFSLNEDMIIQTFPFSAVVPAALEARNILLLQSENRTGADMVEYLGAVFTDLLHSLREPLALCVVFQLYDKDLKSLKVAKYLQLYQFNRYYKLWIAKQSQEPVFRNHKEVSQEPPVALDSVFAILLKEACERGNSTLLEDGVQTKWRDLTSWLPPEQLLLGVKHVLLHLKSTVENFSSTLEDMLTLIFRHPALESWFLALELRSIPQPGLNPVTVKLLSAHLNSGVLQLLKTVVSAVTPVLRKELCAGIQDTGTSPEATVKLQILSKVLPPPGSKGLHNLMDCLPAAPERAGNEESYLSAAGPWQMPYPRCLKTQRSCIPGGDISSPPA
ncbi:nucleolar pre-ribosomal-associated protein 1-like isoform X2 [Taeniopygia guttata]|uniref:nucleolar pre-ribosomal-associated protein 1-like isoform X2 n=1 Tax=Taeniopygia guttata TaxID=59729 RepID=UPI003BB8E08E